MHTLDSIRVGRAGAALVAGGTATFALSVLLAVGLGGEASWWFVASSYALAVVGLAGLAAVPTLTRHVMPDGHPGLRYAGTVASLGFAVLAVLSFWQAEFETSLTVDAVGLPAVAYEDDAAPGPASVGAAMAQQLAGRAPQGWLETAGVGAWILALSWAARHTLPAPLPMLGVVVGLLSFVTAVGAAFALPQLHVFGVVAGGCLLLPLWFAGMAAALDQPAEAPVAPARPPRRAEVPRAAGRRWADRHPALSRMRAYFL